MVHWNASSVNISCLTVNTRLSVAKTQEKTLSPDATQTLRVPEQKGFRKKEDRPSGSRKNEGFRKEEGFRGRKAGDGKEFTRERRNEFRFKDESKPRTPRPSTDDGRPKQAPGPRYMHSRRKPEIERENNESMDKQ